MVEIDLKFRFDINGLRALAVIGVVLFHFNEAWLPGGFAGVDVFFVISGYLMTGIIFRGLEYNKFSIFNFYIARAKRIIPALAVLCLFILLFGWFFLIPEDYAILGKHVLSSILFLSNVVFWHESGYFDPSSYEKWLLHTWSLAVEWQFYLIYPVLLVALHKFFSLKIVKVFVLFATVLCFFFSVYATYKWANASYYLLPTRMWEMLIGGVAFLYPLSLSDKLKPKIEILGLFLILISFVFISKDVPWPGYLALFPVLGAFFVIQAQRDNSTLLNNFVLQKIGSWSYSIYLWHWPLVVAIYYFSLNDSFIYLGLFLSISLGAVSYVLVEKHNFFLSVESRFGLLRTKFFCLSLTLTAFLCFSFFYNENRFVVSKEQKEINSKLVMPLRENGYCFNSFENEKKTVGVISGTECYLGAVTEKSKTLLFGDSYAGHYDPFFDIVFKENNASFQSISTNWCSPIFGAYFSGPKNHPAYTQCLINREYVESNIGRYQNLILAGSWAGLLQSRRLNNVGAVIDAATKNGVNVFIMAAPRRYSKNPLKSYFYSVYLDVPFVMSSYDLDSDLYTFQANAYLRKLATNYKNVTFIERDAIFSDSDTFNYKSHKIPFTLDGGHISMLGSINSAKIFIGGPYYKGVVNKLGISKD